MSTTISTVPTLVGFIAWVRSRMQINVVILPSNSVWLMQSYAVALELVNLWINTVSPLIYTLAVYNLAGSFLLNFAQDVNGQCYFNDQRVALKLTTFTPGVVSSTADTGTSVSLLVPDFMKSLTLADLQLLKDPYGRQYIILVQSYGSEIWGLS